MSRWQPSSRGPASIVVAIAAARTAFFFFFGRRGWRQGIEQPPATVACGEEIVDQAVIEQIAPPVLGTAAETQPQAGEDPLVIARTRATLEQQRQRWRDPDGGSGRRGIAAAGGDAPSLQLERAYGEAREAGYLWHEFGDSHLIVGG